MHGQGMRVCFPGRGGGGKKANPRGGARGGGRCCGQRGCVASITRVSLFRNARFKTHSPPQFHNTLLPVITG